MLKNWLKEIIRTVIREEILDAPLIISSRAPSENDIYSEGTIWFNEKNKEEFIAQKVTVEWEKLKRKDENRKL